MSDPIQGVNQVVQGAADFLIFPAKVLMEVPQRLTQSLISGGQDVAQGGEAAMKGDPRTMLEKTAKGLEKLITSPFHALQPAAQALAQGSEMVGKGPILTHIF